MAGSSFYDQISANRRNSFLMALLVVVLLAALGFSIGYAIFGSPAEDWRSRRSPSGSGPLGRVHVLRRATSSC